METIPPPPSRLTNENKTFLFQQDLCSFGSDPPSGKPTVLGYSAGVGCSRWGPARGWDGPGRVTRPCGRITFEGWDQQVKATPSPGGPGEQAVPDPEPPRRPGQSDVGGPAPAAPLVCARTPPASARPLGTGIPTRARRSRPIQEATGPASGYTARTGLRTPSPPRPRPLAAERAAKPPPRSPCPIRTPRR